MQSFGCLSAATLDCSQTSVAYETKHSENVAQYRQRHPGQTGVLPLCMRVCPYSAVNAHADLVLSNTLIISDIITISLLTIWEYCEYHDNVTFSFLRLMSMTAAFKYSCECQKFLITTYFCSIVHCSQSKTCLLNWMSTNTMASQSFCSQRCAHLGTVYPWSLNVFLLIRYLSNLLKWFYCRFQQ